VTVNSLLLLTVIASSIAKAGPLFPCVKAAASKNGQFLLIAEDHVLQIVAKEPFINKSQWISGPATFWTEWTRWSVSVDLSQPYNGPDARFH
jgi:hypothetical protein